MGCNTIARVPVNLELKIIPLNRESNFYPCESQAISILFTQLLLEEMGKPFFNYAEGSTRLVKPGG